MSDNQFLKKLIPSPIRKYLRKVRDKKVAQEFSGLSNAEVFEKFMRKSVGAILILRTANIPLEMERETKK